MKNYREKIPHILIWAAGTVFLLTGAFQTNIWFDESYTVGLMNHNLWEIIKISAADVHPPFYYLLLKLYSLLFGNGIISLRVFSVACSSLFALLGFTHIRKDFGSKVGFWFTASIFLFASTFRYANEIRMYSLAPFLVTLMFIYAYRYDRSGFADQKSRKLFLLFGILSAYTHHYGLVATASVNLLFFWRKRQDRKTWLKNAAIQVGSYFWGIYCLLFQFLHVAGGFWISMSYPEIIHDTFSFFFLGDDLSSKTDISLFSALAFLFWIASIVYFIRLYKTRRDEALPATPALITLGTIIGLIFAVSLISPLYYVRYLTVISGLVFFFLAFTYAKIQNRFVKAGILLFVIGVLAVRMIPIMEVRYSDENAALDRFITETFEEGDVIVSEEFNIAVIAMKYPEIGCYFYNSENWGVEEAYEAYSPHMETIRDLSAVSKNDGRIWILNSDNTTLGEYFTENSPRKTITDYGSFTIPYHNLGFDFTLVK